MNYSILSAIQAGQDFAMQQNPNVIIMGQDIGKNGGVFRATDGLWQKYGSKRVIDMPISEALMSGMATGMSIAGLRPIVEFQFSGFMLSAVEQLMIHAGRMRSRTQSKFTCPLVIRAPYGANIGAPEHHSESPEALFAHIPGIRVVVPSNPKNAHGLLLSAIDDPDPVVILEPKKLYHSVKSAIEIGYKVPLDRAFIEKYGNDVTIIGWGAMMPTIHKACNELPNISCEIIDACSIYPLDKETIFNSVKKTGRVIVVHEASKNLGVGAEILASIAEECTQFLVAPPIRIAGYDIPTPYFKHEHLYFPCKNDILVAMSQLMEYRYA